MPSSFRLRGADEHKGKQTNKRKSKQTNEPIRRQTDRKTVTQKDERIGNKHMDEHTNVKTSEQRKI